MMGGKPGKIRFVLGSYLYNKHKYEFMNALLEVSQNTAFKKLEKKIGPKDSLSEVLYVPMLVSDMFIQGCNLIHGGTDQNTLHDIARTVAPKLTQSALKVKRFFGTEIYKPIALQQHVLLSLKKPKVKMSKSDPASAIFITDSESNVKGKLLRAYCPPSIKDNPILDICKHVIFRSKNPMLEMTRPMRGGGQVHFYEYSDLEKVYLEGKLHPVDLKAAVAEKISDILEPARAHFESGRNKKILSSFMRVREKRKIRLK
jgi:tyrosyl-tRNA synthetase